MTRVSSSDDIQLWDEAADRYAQHAGGVDDSFYRRLSPFLWQALRDVTGQRLLDLGCGHGWLTEQLRLAGATAMGIDGSTALLRQASATYPKVTFTAHDLTTGLPRPRQTYHGIVAHMVLMDLPELQPLIADVRASLAPNGVFVFSILHPCFFAQTPVEDTTTGERYRKVTGYLHHERRWITSFGGHHHYHRPLSWYIDLLTRSGLVITGLHEPPTLPAHLNPEPEWTDYERWFATIPTMLAIACQPART
jgi:SAM-dependent methyltransferase